MRRLLLTVTLISTILATLHSQPLASKMTTSQTGVWYVVAALLLLIVMRSKSGRPKIIIGATTDITAARLRQQEQKDTMLRYRHIFNSALVDTVSYDERGIIDDMNEKARKAVVGGIQRVRDAKISVQDVLDAPDLSLDNMDFTYLTQIYKSADDPRPCFTTPSKFETS